MYEKYEGYMIRKLKEDAEKSLRNQKKDRSYEEIFESIMERLDRIETKLTKLVEKHNA
jgi:hypothetical protein